MPDDKSYRQAKGLVDNGDLGVIHAVETTGIDQADPNGTALDFPSRCLILTVPFSLFRVLFRAVWRHLP